MRTIPTRSPELEPLEELIAYLDASAESLARAAGIFVRVDGIHELGLGGATPSDRATFNMRIGDAACSIEVVRRQLQMRAAMLATTTEEDDSDAAAAEE